MNPYFVTGFIDSIKEECFFILLTRSRDSKLGWNIRINFQIKVNIKDRELLAKIQGVLGGVIINNTKSSSILRITSISEIIDTIIPHFDKYPLMTQRQEEFELFKEVALIIHNKQHLTEQGFREILSLKAGMRNGLTKLLVENFPNTLPKFYGDKVNKNLPKYLDPYWIGGFTEGKGSFKIEIEKPLTSSSVKLNFQVIVNESDKELLALLINQFNCGTIIAEASLYKIFTVTNFEDISNIIVPFFQKYPLQGIKNLDLDVFIKVAGLIKNKKAKLTSTELYGILGRNLARSPSISDPLSTFLIPALVYSNADTAKAGISLDNRGRSGVYSWVNNESGSRYVGSSADLSKRLGQYYNLEHLMKVNMSIYKALLKYGHSKFSLEILEYCDVNLTIEREQYYIDLLKPRYNMLKVAGSPLGYKHTPEAIAKIRLSSIGRKHSEETKAILRAANTGRTVSEDIKSKIRSSILKAQFKHSESAKFKIGKSSLARLGWVNYVTNVKTGITVSYPSRLKAAAALNMSPLTLKRYIESGKIYKNTYKITVDKP